MDRNALNLKMKKINFSGKVSPEQKKQNGQKSITAYIENILIVFKSMC